MGKTVERKRKKKGRPSLLDLQKRSLRLQQQLQQEQKKFNPNPSPNPYVRFPGTGAGRRRTRRSSITEPEADDRGEEGEEEDEDSGKRREKKLKLVLRIHDHSGNSPRHLGPSASESEGEGLGPRLKRKIDPIGGDGQRSKADRHSSLKATEPLRAEASNPGPTTPLPDKKLLFFILDILLKKDTYGVFSEPVDPEELPDYHEVIENPMDFSTVRKKLSWGAYKNLEQFEKDVFLISSNGMRYNAPDTIYYRQARTIQDHAKKNFENLRQESDKEPETKTVVRRGRPPSKNINRPVSLLPAELAATGFSSDPTLANFCGVANLPSQNHQLSKKGSEMDKPGSTDVSSKFSYGLQNSDSFGWISINKVDASEEYSGFARDMTTRFGKRAPILEENRRNTYSQFQPYNYICEMPILSQFDSEKKQLAAVGLHMEHAYARSLAQFAAHFGSIGWAIAAKKIEKVLPSGMNYGRGWVGDIDEASPQQSRPLIQCVSPQNQSSQAMPSSCVENIECNNKLSQKLEPSCGGRYSDREENNDDQLGILINGAANETELAIQPKTPFHVHSNRGIPSTANGFTSGFRFNLPSQAGNVTRPLRPPMFFGSELPMIHARERDMALRNNINNTLIQAHSNHIDSEMAKTSNSPSSFSKPVLEHGQDLQWRGASMPAKSEPVPPDLNIRFQSPGSPSSGAMAESQQPDLALQL